MAGNTRRNRNSKQKNKPIVPMNVAQSQNVGEYMPHEDGRKSRCRLVTTITNRSSHMPTLTTSAMTNSTAGVRRTRRNQSACGMTTLHVISDQYHPAYGPVIRLYGTK